MILYIHMCRHQAGAPPATPPRSLGVHSRSFLLILGHLPLILPAGEAFLETLSLSLTLLAPMGRPS